MGDSSVRRLEIEFDRQNGTYLPGELVSGKVLAEFTRPKRIRGLRVVIVGESVVQWSADNEKPDSDGHYQKVAMTSREDYFNSKFYLLGSSTGAEIELPPGQQSYPFNIQLPMNLPSSFEHEYGYVRYTVKAIFDRPWKFDHEVKAAFTVLSTYDLNRRAEASLTIREEMDKDFCCLCICPTGSMDAVISIPYSGYVPGQSIPVTVECNNESNIEVEKIKVQLKQKLKFHATVPRWADKEEEEIIKEEKCMAPFTGNSENHVTLYLKVPPVAPSSLEYCGIIDLDYVLRVVICFSGWHCSIERTFPILIGTVPLYSSFNTQGSNVVTAPPPSAPLLQTPSSIVNVPFPSTPQPGSGTQTPALGFVVANPPYPSHPDPNNLPPPSYEACMFESRGIRDKDESEYVMGARTPFSPRYPVYDYNLPIGSFPSAPVYGKQ